MILCRVSLTKIVRLLDKSSFSNVQKCKIVMNCDKIVKADSKFYTNIL